MWLAEESTQALNSGLSWELCMELEHRGLVGMWQEEAQEWAGPRTCVTRYTRPGCGPLT